MQLPHLFDFVMPRPILFVLGSTKHVLLDRIVENGNPGKKVTYQVMVTLYVCLPILPHKHTS